MHGYKEGRFVIKKMIRLGLTGGVGMGKSTASHFLYDLGFKVADTDDKNVEDKLLLDIECLEKQKKRLCL